MLGRIFASLLGGKGDASAAAGHPPANPPAPDNTADAATPAPLPEQPAPLSDSELRRQIEDRNLLDDAKFRRRQLMVATYHARLAGAQLRETLLARPELADPKRLERYGGKTYSQNDEDGIIAEIFRRIGAPHRTFVEFGCGDGMENNTVCLLAQGWRGLWMDGGEQNAARIHTAYAPLIKRGILQFKQVFIDRDNIDGLIAAAGLGPEIDLLSIDLDGNDFYLWEAISSVSPRVVAIEYNGKFLAGHDWCMAYDAGYQWNGSDLMGCSLDAATRLAHLKGYRLVGCNLTGANAFYVREDLAGELFASPATPQHLFQPARYSLTDSYVSGHSSNTMVVLQGAFASLGLPWPPEEGSSALIAFSSF